MKRIWMIAGIATLVAILGAAVVGVVAFAQDDAGSGWPFDFRARFKAAVAEILKIDVDTYDAAVEQAQNQVVDEALAEGWLTEDQAERMRERMDQDLPGPGFGGRGFMGPKMGFMGRGEASLFTVAAEQLDMTVSELMTELRDGKSIADVAGEKSVSLETITNAYVAQLEENLKQAVEDGKMTQNQADWMLEQTKEKLPDLLDNTCEGGFRGGHGPGRMWGFPGEQDAGQSDA